MADHRSWRARLRRRAVSVPSLFAIAISATAPLWLPVVVAADAVRLRRRLPLAGLLAFAAYAARTSAFLLRPPKAA